MLAANLVAEAGNLRAQPLKTKTIVDVKRPLGENLSFRILKPPAARCICRDRDYIGTYARKYAVKTPF